MSDLDAIRERHRPVAFVATAWCIEDVQEWPCDAVRLLTELSVQQEANRNNVLAWHLIGEAADHLADALTRYSINVGDESVAAEERDALLSIELAEALERYRKERG